ncbi:uncharacterized protein NP_0480A [Natronomonas pharaonis DSM 2160]|uniref:Uncharacterized protein n=1 Tax=Natronomonas pharaonis (strain ATCC 35678 / DSM 2160 / CIP 103997 / JCM 8858 / NBRC 14720 / NCIMB 2260 / Gabara) TaxID=348780 RepID=A0A1U7ETT4_NATPD|nr:hypothetical protein [Natronomonas pharaonis]CAI48331.1 uncharacterized protein NP_0480A [Natronomonas pharaonis DSM 2160]
MSQNPATPVTVSDCEVMASVDDGDDGEQLVIAELCRDGAYLTMPTSSTVAVDEWR